jgi:hypothetical protein
MLVTITIKVNYDTTTVENGAELREAIKQEVDLCVDDGLLTPLDDEIVDNYSIEVV